MTENAEIAKKQENPSRKKLIGLSILFLLIDLVLVMPCLCSFGVAFAKIKVIFLLLLTGRAGYLYYRRRLTVKDLVFYECSFVVLWIIELFMHG